MNFFSIPESKVLQVFQPQGFKKFDLVIPIENKD